MHVSTLLRNRYRVLQELGSGAFGQTFIVEDLDLPSRRCCVLKLLKPINDSRQYRLIQERFDREAAILEKLGSGAEGRIPQLYAYFAEDDLFYLVQEWIDGKTLAQRLKEEGRLPESEVRLVLVGMLEVLDFIHSQGIIHRDIKPENIMQRRANGKLVLIDFGIVKEVMQMDSQLNPTSSIVAGTPAYMPLEQAAGKPVFGSDLYSLGMTAISLLTGKNPTMIVDPVSGEVRWREHAPTVGRELADLLDRATESHFRDRFKTAKEMLDALVVTGQTVALPTQAYTSGDRYSSGRHPAYAGYEAQPEFPQSGIQSSVVVASTVVPGYRPPAYNVVVPPAPEPPPPPPPQPVPQVDPSLDLAFWDSIKTSTNPKSFEAYLNKFPHGQFADLARIKLDEMTTASRTQPKTFDFDTCLLDADANITDFRTKRIQGYAEDLGDGLVLEMANLPAGMFQMGSNDAEAEKPSHQVRISAFSIGRFPVTQGQWRVVAGMPRIRIDLKPDPSAFKGDGLPVEQVSWEEAVEFCARLSARTGKSYRLPSEAEWEYACRANSQTSFSFGETITSDLVNYDGNFPFGKAPKGKYLGQTVAVGSLGASNNFGLYDMHGNVNEWCADPWHPNYKGAPSNGAAWDQPDDPKRVLRGGSWIAGALHCRSAARSHKHQGTRSNYVGFRVAMSDDKKLDSGASRLSQKVPAVQSPSLAESGTQSPANLSIGQMETSFQPAASSESLRPVAFSAEWKKNLSLQVAHGVLMEFVLIEPGTFRMGSNDYENEKPIHEVSIGRPFYLSKYLTTQLQWMGVTGKNPSNFKRNDNPVDSITWFDCMEFIDKLNARFSEEYVFRLPSEAEWEYACRAGSEAPYCFGGSRNMLGEYAWFDSNSANMSHPVGKKKPNAFGLYDMHGNLYEWCQDRFHDNYYDAPDDGSAWDDGEETEARVMRGGSWSYYSGYCRSAFRYRADPNTKRSIYGVRLVVVPKF